MRQLFTNNAVSLLGASISASDMTLEVTAGFGTLYPSPGPDEFFLVTLENRTATVREHVHRIKEHITPVIKKNYIIKRGEIIDI